MKSIIPWKRNNDLSIFEPFDHSFSDFSREIDSIFNSFLNNASPHFSLVNQTNALTLDIAEKDDSYVVKADLPGVNKDEISIDLNDNYLTIKAERKEEKEEKKERYYLAERKRGVLSRTITVPENTIDQEKINAKYNNGVLELTLPKLPEKVKKPARQINIES